MPQVPLTVNHATAVPAPPSSVWAMIAEPSTRPAWMTELRGVESVAGPVSVGDRFTGQSSILFHDFVGASEVTEVEPGRLLVEEVVIGARFVSRWEVTPTATGSTVHHTIDVHYPAGPFSFVERWVLGWRLLRMQKKSLRNLAARF